MTRRGPDLIRIWFTEVWDKRRAEAIDEHAAADWDGHDLDLPGSPDLSWRERFKLVHEAYCSAFPDITIAVDRTIGDGDYVSAHCTIRGTHLGEGLGFPATGRSVNFTGIVLVRYVDGRIAESWESWNFLKMYSQLGQNLTYAPLA
ncbi:MAG TPA: ester cyclase [Stellaceae bacterium]|nr:ester cyclase [Stellaceae bacterium]